MLKNLRKKNQTMFNARGIHGYCHREWTLQPEFKSWMKLFAFCIALMPLEKV